MKKSATKSYALRIDGPLVKPLQELKKQNRRSLNAEINAALEAWVAGAQQPTAASDGAAKKQAKRKKADVDANSADSIAAAAGEATNGSEPVTGSQPATPAEELASVAASKRARSKRAATSEEPTATSEEPATTLEEPASVPETNA